MEGLKKLEKVQNTIMFLQNHNLIDSSSSPHLNHPDSNRFLANLLLLLIQPCGQLDMEAKSHLISATLPKISASFLEEASLFLGENIGEEGFCNGIHSDQKAVVQSLNSEISDMAIVGYDAMQRANSTLEDFCRSYFMFHGMDANKPQTTFRYLPLLSFTESYIYQLDNLNEKLMQLPTSGDPLNKPPDAEGNRSCIISSAESFKTDPFRPLVLLLERLGLLTERIKEEFKCGEQYWTIERKLCSALTNRLEISIDDVKMAIHLKSFDYRVLNLLLYQLRGEKVNELHMDFLSVSEFLVEVSDDLFDYEDDVLENSFNVLRMFVRIYGSGRAPVMLAKFIAEAEEKYNCLLKALDPILSVKYQRRCEEATSEGGEKSTSPLGSWTIPPIIKDEELYRSEHLRPTTATN
ncbi:hypothetical protein DCAR_0416733 [Daucus carota subsp. sativus]|uniref:Uncharacterized protein n=1 Tax=Daucus carota subsp. sativus TaxID=79200 RepID=A0AAF1AVX0_DAUCS|nr:PREDICTED: uncharacterized protein LOC108219381 isoform X1 [Daucus carota subsp. sativus]XP_017248288.1 PREDICTED: uncharacterized protein LOC108219381 isoform X1 [Daucus carota subsp. sativus]XP_017248289.1 PREDICTED: uncharacterized protein LOC108219381 isoform X1 [Daucus carota subsp. sativus]WOG97393.1 hypothetical protein DCAR_0416733 [Daucus carota subsp. sativus]